MKTIYLNWYGPFTYDAIKNGVHCTDEGCEFLEGYGLYAFTGKKKNQRQDAYLQYIGITERPYSQRVNEHKIGKLNEINRDQKIWLGKIGYEDEPVLKDLKDAEYILVYFNASDLLNKAKKSNAPKFKCAVISQFFKKDMKPYKNVPSIMHDIPEVLIWTPTDEAKLRYCRKLSIIDAL